MNKNSRGLPNVSQRIQHSNQRIKLTAKTVDEDPAGCKRWISREEIKSAKI